MLFVLQTLKSPTLRSELYLGFAAEVKRLPNFSKLERDNGKINSNGLGKDLPWKQCRVTEATQKLLTFGDRFMQEQINQALVKCLG